MTRRTPRLALLALPAVAASLALAGCSIGVSDPAASPTASDPKSSSAKDRTDADPADDTSATPKTGSGLGAIANGPCDGRSFDVDQDGAVLVLDGDCGDVTVSASNVSINLDAADSITITGDAVQIIVNGELGALTLRGTGDTVNGEAMGQVAVDGSGGTVIATSIAALTSAGSYNIVNWDSGVRSAQDTGTGNTFVGPA